MQPAGKLTVGRDGTYVSEKSVERTEESRFVSRTKAKRFGKTRDGDGMTYVCSDDVRYCAGNIAIYRFVSRIKIYEIHRSEIERKLKFEMIVA